MAAVSVARTSLVVRVTIIRSVKFSTSKKKLRKPTRTRVTVWRKVLKTWYSIRRRNTIFTVAQL